MGHSQGLDRAVAKAGHRELIDHAIRRAVGVPKRPLRYGRHPANVVFQMELPDQLLGQIEFQSPFDEDQAEAVGMSVGHLAGRPNQPIIALLEDSFPPMMPGRREKYLSLSRDARVAGGARNGPDCAQPLVDPPLVEAVQAVDDPLARRLQPVGLLHRIGVGHVDRPGHGVGHRQVSPQRVRSEGDVADRAMLEGHIARLAGQQGVDRVGGVSDHTIVVAKQGPPAGHVAAKYFAVFRRQLVGPIRETTTEGIDQFAYSAVEVVIARRPDRQDGVPKPCERHATPRPVTIGPSKPGRRDHQQGGDDRPDNRRRQGKCAARREEQQGRESSFFQTPRA